MYHIEIRRSAKKQLLKIPSRPRERLLDKIYHLACDPDDPSIDVVKLTNKVGFRLRVGTYRIIFDRDDILRIIAIEKIGARGNIYK